MYNYNTFSELVFQQGDCSGYNIRWYYNSIYDLCKKFVYTGCTGNDNRFDSQAACETRCKGKTEMDTKPPHRYTIVPVVPTTTPPTKQGRISFKLIINYSENLTHQSFLTKIIISNLHF